MAIGTITVSAVSAPNAPPTYIERITFPGDGAYPTGGTAGFQATFRAKVKQTREIIAVIPQDCGVYLPGYDKANDKLKVRKVSDGTEVTNATDLSATTFDVLVISK